MTRYADRFWTSAEGLRLFARDYAGASGPARLPIILLHGLTRNSRDFEDLAPRLAETGRRIIAPDIRGRGHSDRDPIAQNYNPGTYAGDIQALSEALGIARAHFLGTSMGGLITMIVAAAAPHLVASAILNDVGPEVDPAGLARIATYVGQPFDPNDWNEAADYARRHNETAFPDFQDEDWARFARRTFREREDGRLELDYDPAIMSAVAPGTIPDLWPLFATLATRPVLIVRGQNSDILSAATAEKMISSGPMVQLAQVPGIGHAPMLTEPTALSAILDFLAGLP